MALAGNITPAAMQAIDALGQGVDAIVRAFNARSATEQAQMLPALDQLRRDMDRVVAGQEG